MRNLVIGLLVWGWMGLAQAEPVRVCEHADGSLTIVVWTAKYLALPADQRPTPEHLAGATCEDRDRSDMPTDRSRRAAWRKQPDGTIAADPTIETPQELADNARKSARKKLKDLGLTESELDALR